MWLRRGLSVAIVFHLVAIIAAPMKDSYLAFLAAPVVGPYVNLLELSTGWNFFAPEPGPPPVFVEWRIRGEKGQEVSRGKWPEFPDHFFLRERQNRRIAFARFLLTSDERMEKVLVPYLCRTTPGARGVELWKVSYTIPPLRDVASGSRKVGDEVGADRRFVSDNFCGGRS